LLGCTLITPRLDENINHLPVLADSPPQIPIAGLDSHEQLNQILRVTQAILSSPESPSVFGTDLPTPLADGFVADHDPTLGQKIFNISETQAEVVEPNGLTDDFRGNRHPLGGWCS
jgi:hypothetical protein